MIDEVFSYTEMCLNEGVNGLQKGMSYGLNPKYSVITMSTKNNSPYNDKILEDGITIEYEGHDVPSNECEDPKKTDQTKYSKRNNLTQNGLFAQAVDDYKNGIRKQPKLVKAYEKIYSGVWDLKGFFNLIDYRYESDGVRNRFIFILRLSEIQDTEGSNQINIKHTRLIPSEIKKEVYKRDNRRCVKCGSKTNLHFDHDLPFSKGGTSLTSKNIKLLCMKCNLKKGARVE